MCLSLFRSLPYFGMLLGAFIDIERIWLRSFWALFRVHYFFNFMSV